MHITTAKAVSFKKALDPSFKEYQEQVIKNAKTLVRSLMDNGIDLCTKGTDNHLILMSLTSLRIMGKDTEALLGKGGLIVNKNTISNGTQFPFVASDIRIGTAAMVNCGFNEEDFTVVGQVISSLLKERPSCQESLNMVKDLCQKHPLYK